MTSLEQSKYQTPNSNQSTRGLYVYFNLITSTVLAMTITRNALAQEL